MRDVAVIGVGMNKWGELWQAPLRDIFVEAALKAMDDAGVDKLDAMYIGSMSSGLFVGQEHIGSQLADYLGQAPIPATRVESACASGGLAFRQAVMNVALGWADVVMASGVEKMTDVDGGGATYALATAADQEYEGFHGITFPGLYSMIARAHMDRYGTTLEQLAHVSVKNHRNGAKNPNAQYPFEVTLEGVMDSTMVADPLRILHCSPITDGAAAAILCPLDMVQNFKDHPVIAVIGSGQATDTIALHARADMTYLKATEVSTKQALEMAGKTINDVDTIELHDCFTIAEICVLEAMGVCEVGKGGTLAESGETAIGGRIPVNTSGGLKSKGHPVGATGIAQIMELTLQLRGEAGDRQVDGAKVGLAQNMGGSGGSTVVHVLEAK